MFFAGRYVAWSAGFLLEFLMGKFSLATGFLQIFGQIAHESAATVRFERSVLAGGLGGVSVFCEA